jgi:hypothetical protein
MKQRLFSRAGIQSVVVLSVEVCQQICEACSVDRVRAWISDIHAAELTQESAKVEHAAQSGPGFVYVIVGHVRMTSDSPDQACFLYSFRDIEYGLTDQQNSLLCRFTSGKPTLQCFAWMFDHLTLVLYDPP